VRLEAHLRRLDPEARQTRFFTPASDRSIAVLVAAARPCALVTFEPDGLIRGTAEIHPGEATGTAEIAVSVEAPWQHRGIGARLTSAATRTAAELGHADIRLMCQRRNLPMLQIARALSACALPLADWALALFRLDPALADAPGPAAGAC
jgi:GNAT superfamily N-acetyltransferase